MDAPQLYRVGSIAAFAYVAAQIAQRLIRIAMGDQPDPLLTRLETLDVVRASVIWLSFWALPVAFYALYRRLAGRFLHLALLGLAASLFFVACELFYRTIDLFVVTRHWAANPELAGRVALWNDVVDGWYVMLLAAHVIGLAAFAGALGLRGGRLERIAAAAIAAYTLVSVMRLAAYAVPTLEPICAALYFPTAVACFAAIGVTLRQRQADSVP
jgi:hypothetical protein